MVLDLGPISHLETILPHPPPEWSALASWYPVVPKPMSGSLGEGRRPGEWIKGVGEDVTLDHFNGTLLLLKLGEGMDWCLGIYSALSLFVFAP